MWPFFSASTCWVRLHGVKHETNLFNLRSWSLMTKHFAMSSDAPRRTQNLNATASILVAAHHWLPSQHTRRDKYRRGIFLSILKMGEGEHGFNFHTCAAWNNTLGQEDDFDCTACVVKIIFKAKCVISQNKWHAIKWSLKLDNKVKYIF